jgi:tight adherence protein B
MTLIVIPLLLIAALVVFVYLAVAIGRHRRAMARLGMEAGNGQPSSLGIIVVQDQAPFPDRWRSAPWLLAFVVLVTLWLAVGLSPVYCVAIAIMVGLLGAQLEATYADRQNAKVEEQLADTIDLMVGTLHAGGGMIAALENAAREVPNPLRSQLAQMVTRVRYGDDPQLVLRRLSSHFPGEPFRLFVAALSVHWEVGGSLAPTLATVGRTVRDRIDVSRRIRSLTVQARLSTVALLVVTYVIAFLMWRKDPDRMAGFLSNPTAQWIVAGTMVMQAIGIVWQGHLSKTRF